MTRAGDTAVRAKKHSIRSVDRRLLGIRRRWSRRRRWSGAYRCLAARPPGRLQDDGADAAPDVEELVVRCELALTEHLIDRSLEHRAIPITRTKQSTAQHRSAKERRKPTIGFAKKRETPSRG